MPPVKPDSDFDSNVRSQSWKRTFLYWISPLLLISLGLHGIIFLVPLPEKETAEDPDIELPEPIEVTTLPPIVEEEAALLAPPAAPIPDPVPEPVVPEPPPVVSPPIVEVPPVVVTPTPTPTPTPASTPAPTPTPTPTPASTSTPTPTPTPTPTLAPSAQPQTYNPEGTTSAFVMTQGGLFASKYGRTEDISYLLDLGYDAGGECFDADKDLEAQIAIVLDKNENIVHSELLKKTGYDLIDTWLLAFVTPPTPAPLPNDVFEFMQQDYPDAPENGYITDYISVTRGNQTEPLVPEGEETAPYGIEAAIFIENNNCGDEKLP